MLNQFLDQDSFYQLGTTEESNFTTFKVKGQEGR